MSTVMASRANAGADVADDAGENEMTVKAAMAVVVTAQATVAATGPTAVIRATDHNVEYGSTLWTITTNDKIPNNVRMTNPTA